MKKQIEFLEEISSNGSIKYVSVENNSNKNSINAVEFLENLYLSYIKKVDINSTTKFVEHVDITTLPNKSYIYYVDIISRIETYVRDRIFKESISVSDQIFIRKEIIRLFPEIIQLIEKYHNHLSKPFSDKYYFSESFGLSWDKIINDSFTENELIYLNFSKKLFDIILNIEEQIKKSFEKSLSENFVHEENKQLHVTKTKNNPIELTDTNVFLFNKIFQDSCVTISYGNLFRHNYSNTGTYFSENYVGQFFQF